MRSITALAAMGMLLAAGNAVAQDAAAGKALFAGRCGVCHQVADAKSTAAAPSLKGVFGRAIAALPDYAYSGALKANGAGKTWTEPELDAFLASPVKYAPGGKMYTAVIDPGERASIVAYLKTAK